jgi:hypothetical protein
MTEKNERERLTMVTKDLESDLKKGRSKLSEVAIVEEKLEKVILGVEKEVGSCKQIISKQLGNFLSRVQISNSLLDLINMTRRE